MFRLASLFRPSAIEIIRSGWALKCAPCCPFNAHLYLRRDFLCSFYGIGGVRERCSRMSAVSVGKLPQFLYYPGMKGIFLGKVRGGWFKGFYGRVLLDIASDRLRFEVCGNELKRMLHGFCLKSALYIRKDFRCFSLVFEIFESGILRNRRFLLVNCLGFCVTAALIAFLRDFSAKIPRLWLDWGSNVEQLRAVVSDSLQLKACNFWSPDVFSIRFGCAFYLRKTFVFG